MKNQSQTSIKGSFRAIQLVVGLLLVFLIIQSCMLWRTCDHGTQAITGLEKEGLPSLRLLASLQEDLAIYRLHSFELMFAQDKDRPSKAAETDAYLKKNIETIEELNRLYPSGKGHDFVMSLHSGFDDYVKTMTQIRLQIDKDFGAAMSMLDKEVPAKVARLNDAAQAVRTYCNQVADERTQLTVDSFGRVRSSVGGFGSVSVIFALLAVLLVTMNSGRVRRALNTIAETLDDVSHSLMGSASTISSSSQNLAESSNQQAGSIEETSTSLEAMASMTKKNAENAQHANELAGEARNAADKGAADMSAMTRAMEDIKKSSDDIAKIIKTIDEIAFQTNILALNAAVEAARAGEAGMGFAVVADEVRNLAQRSAQAARETSEKIEGAINNTTRGVEISAKVSTALVEILEKARQVDKLAAEVAEASREQTQGINQINASVGQMDRVTQTNAASAEESAATARELNGQAVAMKQAVTELLEMIGGSQAQSPSDSSTPAVLRTSPPRKSHSTPATKKLSPFKGVNGHHPTPIQHSIPNGRSEIPMEGDFRDF